MYMTINSFLYPDKEQKKQINKNIEGYNLVWNTIIEENERRKERRKAGEKCKLMTSHIDMNKFIRELKDNNKDYKHLSECCSRALQGACYDLALEYEQMDEYYKIGVHPQLKTDKDNKYTFYFSKASNGSTGSDPVNFESIEKIDRSGRNSYEGIVKLPKLKKMKYSTSDGRVRTINRENLKELTIENTPAMCKLTINIKIGS